MITVILHYQTECIRNIVKRQATLFAESSKFDYRILFEEGKDCQLDKYFDKDLLKIVDLITTSDQSIYVKKKLVQHTPVVEN